MFDPTWAGLTSAELITKEDYSRLAEFDWRIGIIDRRPIFACKYFMARRHWQIIKRDAGGKRSFGGQETIPVEVVPRSVMKGAMAVANLIGDGLYGVDMKQVGDKAYVVEINDNPNIDSGVEDTLLKDNLYLTVMQVFLKRIEERKRERSVY